MGDKELRNLKLEEEHRLEQFVNSIHRLKDKKERHFLFMSYDHMEDEEQLYEFWRDTVHDLIGKGFNRTYATPDQLVKCFTIDGRKPMGLKNILQEMYLRQEFIIKDKILDESHYKVDGWLSSQFNKVMGFFSKSTPDELDGSKELVSVVWLENECESLQSWAFQQTQQVFDIQEIKHLLKSSGKTKDDIKLILTHLRNTGRMIGDDYVKIGEKDQIDEISDVEKTEFRLKNAVKQLDGKLLDIRSKIDDVREKAKVSLRNQDREKAARFCREKKGLEKIETTLRGMQMKIEKQIIDISIAMQTKNTLECLKLSTNEQHLIDEDIEEAQDLMDTIDEQNYNAQKINDLFSATEEDTVEDEELLKELDAYEAPEGDKENISYQNYYDKDVIGTDNAYDHTKPQTNTEDTYEEAKELKNVFA